MDHRKGWAAMFLASWWLAGCGGSAIGSAAGARPLSQTELDSITAGSATAVSNADARAAGAMPLTTTMTNTLTSSGVSPSGVPFANPLISNYASAQTTAIAAAAPLTQTAGALQIAVAGQGGGASIDATSSASAAGSGRGRSAVDMQLYAMSIAGADIVFGSADAVACCAPLREATTTAAGAGGGNWHQISASPVSTDPGQTQSRVDISVDSSALPILDAGAASMLGGPNPSQQNSQ